MYRRRNVPLISPLMFLDNAQYPQSTNATPLSKAIKAFREGNYKRLFNESSWSQETNFVVAIATNGRKTESDEDL